jgi:hypothetical protein
MSCFLYLRKNLNGVWFLFLFLLLKFVPKFIVYAFIIADDLENVLIFGLKKNQ